MRAGAAAAVRAFLLLVGLSLVGLTLLARDLLIQQSLAVYCVVRLLLARLRGFAVRIWYFSAIGVCCESRKPL